MKYLKTKHQRNSAKITALITIILLLLLFVVGPPYMDPPEEYGVAVNFGNSNFGRGNIQPKKPVKSEPKIIEELPKPEPAKAEPTQSSETKEEVLTQDNAEAIAIKKQKEAEARAKAVAEAKAKAEAERIAKEKREQDEKRKKLDALMGGLNKSDGKETGSEGNDNKAGDKGQLDGNPYATSYFGGAGTGSGGVGYGLNGRKFINYTKIIPDCQEKGRVVVEIHVNKQGKVFNAIPGVKQTFGDICLYETAKKIALSHKWHPDSKAPTKQIGFVVVNFK